MIKGKISVVLPVHYVNRPWLMKSIESVLNQDCINFELIIVNDMATENIDDLAKYYEIEKYVKNDHLGRLSYSFNRGFETADGEYFSWVAADDFMLPGMLNQMRNELEKRPDISIISGRTKIIDENGVENKKLSIGPSIAERYGFRFENNVLDKRYTMFTTISSCWLMRRNVWEETGGFDEALYGEEDYEFWIRASRKFKIYRLPKETGPLYVYRTHSKSISRTVPYCYTKARVKILKKEQELFPNDSVIKKAIKHFEKKSIEEWKKHQINRIRSLVRLNLSRSEKNY